MLRLPAALNPIRRLSVLTDSTGEWLLWSAMRYDRYWPILLKN